MALDQVERTLEPTPHRRQQYQRDGRPVRSGEVVSVGLLALGLLGLVQLGPAWGQRLSEVARQGLGRVGWLQLDADAAVWLAHELLAQLAALLLPLLGLVLLAAVAANLAQVGFRWLPASVLPDVGRIDPARGAQRMLSPEALLRAATDALRLGLVLTVGAWGLWTDRERIVELTLLDAGPLAAELSRLTLGAAVKSLLALACLAAVDYGLLRWRHERQLRMSPEELRKELKSSQGDPQVVSRRQRLRQQSALGRVDALVGGSSVVVAGPRGLIVALRYDAAAGTAPLLTIKGRSWIADRIRQSAERQGIPVVSRPALAAELYAATDLQQPVPSSCYREVAQVLRDAQGQSMKKKR